MTVGVHLTFKDSLDQKFPDVVLPGGWKQRADTLDHAFDVGTSRLVGMTDQLDQVCAPATSAARLKEDPWRAGCGCESSAGLQNDRVSFSVSSGESHFLYIISEIRDYCFIL